MAYRNGSFSLDEVTRKVVGIYGQDGTITDITTGSELAASSGAGLVGSIRSATDAAARYLDDEIDDLPISPASFLAVNDGVTVNSAAFTKFLASLANRRGVIPSGTYLVDNSTPFSLPSNCELIIAPGAVLKANANGSIFNTTGKSNITIRGSGKVLGTGAPGAQLLAFVSCDRVNIREIEVTQSGTSAIKFEGCTNSSILFTHLHHNTHYGIDERSGAFNRYEFNDIHDNGRPSAGNNLFGRGINFYLSSYCVASRNDIYDNTEYGVRLYGEAGDVTGCNYCTISDNILRDNGDVGAGAVELYVYDDSGLVNNNTLCRNTVIKTVSRGQFLSMQGDDNQAYGNKFVAVDNGRSITAVLFYAAARCRVYDNEAYGVASFAVFSGSNPPIDCEIDDNKAYGVVNFIPSIGSGSGNKVRRNTATHGGAGTADRGIVLATANDHELVDNTLDGFYRGIEITISNPTALITRNKTKNSTQYGCYAEAVTDQTGLRMYGNHLDSCWPGVLGTMFPYTGTSLSRRTATWNGTPAASGTNGGILMNWAVGDRFWNSAPAVGTPKSWVCTVAGTPGTWVSEGNL